MGFEEITADLHPPGRLVMAAAAARAAGLSALLLTPGPDLRYVTGYDAQQLERLTCLALPAEGASAAPFLLVPRLELPAAQASPAGRLGLEIVPWDETADPYALLAGRLGPVEQVGLSDQMWALMALRLRDALPGARQALASQALRGAARPQDAGRGGSLARGRRRRSTGCTRRCRTGSGRAVPSGRWPRTSRMRSSQRATPGSISRSSARARTRASPHHEASRPDHRARRRRGRRHRRHHAERLLLGLHENLRDWRAAA